MSKPQKQTTTTTAQLSPEQQALIKPAVAAGQNYAANPPQLPNYSQVAGFDPMQTAGQQSLLNMIMPLQQFAQGAQKSNSFLMDPAILNPSSNPALQGTIDAAVRPITENLLESVLPTVRGDAITSGQFGGSRQGIAEGLSVGRAAKAVGDTSANISTQGYLAGLDSMAKGQALSPQIANLQLLPGMVQSGVGDVRRGLTQAQLSEQAYKDMYAQVAPWLAAKEVASVGAGLPGGSTTATTTMPGQNPLATMLGLGATGAGLLMGGPAGAGLGGSLAGMLSGGMGGGISPAALQAILMGSGMGRGLY